MFKYLLKMSIQFFKDENKKPSKCFYTIRLKVIVVLVMQLLGTFKIIEKIWNFYGFLMGKNCDQ